MDLSSFLDAAESNLRFLAMLSGPFYPILHVVKERLVYSISIYFFRAGSFLVLVSVDFFIF